MRKNIFSTTVLTILSLFFISGIQASHLNGLWRNERQNITIRIEQEENGFRAKRIDQGVWYRYIMQDSYAYVDRNGNWYEIINDDELEWNEAATNKRIIFQRIDSRGSDPWTDRERIDREDPRDRHQDRDAGYDRLRIEGRWYDRSSKERLEIEEIQGGYRIKTHHGQWEKYTADRSGSRLRSRSGNTIRMIDRNTLQWQNARDRHEKIFIRQGYGNNKVKHKDHWKDQHRDHRDKRCG